MWSNFHTNTCDKIPELGQKCWLDRPDSLPAVRSQKGVESGNETTFLSKKCLFKGIRWRSGSQKSAR